MKRITTLLFAAAFLAVSAFSAFAAEKLVVYTSMKESIIGSLKVAFVKKYPDIAMDYQSAGAGKLMAKIATERQSGKIMADIIWTSEVPDFFNMKAEGILEKYESPELKAVINPFPDYDGSFTAIRLGTLVSDVLAFAGGPTISEYRVVDGGPMMGRVLADAQQSVTKTTSGLLVLPPDHNVVARKVMDPAKVRRITNTVCCQCSQCSDLCPRNLLGHSLHPHKLMRVLNGQTLEQPIAKEALLCSECGICEKFACPMGISPREVNALLKKELMGAGMKWEYDGHPLTPSRFREERRIPTSRLVKRLGLAGYEAHPPFAGDFEPAEVRIPLRQHIGAPAVAVVSAGQSVKVGDVIGEIPENAMGARVHASINGVVTAVENGMVTIKGQGR